MVIFVPKLKTMTTGIRKTIGITGMILFLAMPSTAKITYGVKAGLGRSWMIQKLDLDYHSGPRFGYSVAALADIPFYRRFSFRPEIALYKQGGYFNSQFDQFGSPKLKYTADYHSLQLPFDIAFTIPITGVRMAIFGGVVPDFHLWGKMNVKGIGEEPMAKQEMEMKSFDLGINSGISVEFKNIIFSINMLLGTMDRRIEKIESESAVYQNNLTFSLGYRFR